MADTGYSPVPSVNPSAQPLPAQQIPADAGDFGADIGQGLQRTGAIMRQAKDAEFALELRFAEMENETRALDASTEYTRQSNQIINDFRQLNGQQAVDALPGVEKRLVEIDREIGKGLKAPGAQRAYKARSANILTQNMQVSGLHAANQAAAASVASKVAAIAAAQSRFVTNFGLTNTEPDISDIVSLSAQLAFEKGLPKEAADVFIQKNVGAALGQVIDVRINNGKFDEAREIFEEAKTHKIPGTDIPVFNGDQIVAVSNAIDRGERIQRAEEQQKIAAQQQFEREQNEKAYSSAVGQIMVDPTKLDLKAVANNPYLSGEHKGSIQRLYDYRLEQMRGGGDPDANKGPGFWETFRAVTATNPTITSQQQIYDLTGQGRPLSLTGANALVNILQERQRGSSQGNFDAQKKSQFFSNMHDQIVTINLPEYSDSYFRFFMDKTRQFDKGIADGKSIDQLLSPESPDYIGKDWQTYQPKLDDESMAIEAPPEAQKSWLGYLGDVLGLGGGAPKFSTQELDRDVRSGVEGSSDGIAALKAAIIGGQITRDAAAEYALRRGWVRPSDPNDAAAPGQVVPPVMR